MKKKFWLTTSFARNVTLFAGSFLTANAIVIPTRENIIIALAAIFGCGIYVGMCIAEAIIKGGLQKDREKYIAELNQIVCDFNLSADQRYEAMIKVLKGFRTGEIPLHKITPPQKN